jgi:hemolysin-activating ACP:hemolysin acyltransferase
MTNKILKFREWDEYEKEFRYWTMNDLCTYSTKDEKPSALCDWCLSLDKKDVNFKEIYTGDIVMFKDRKIGTVVYINDVFKRILNGEKVEIIGNIYEDNNLIK